MRALIPMFLVAAMGAAHAERRGIVLEVYTGERPANAEDLIKPIRDELAKRGFIVGHDAIEQELVTHGSRPAISDGGLPDYDAKAKAALARFVNADFKEASEAFAPLIRQAHANPGELVLDPTKREALRTLVIDMAISQKELGDDAQVKELYRDLVRSFPDNPPLPGTHGPVPAKGFDEARRELKDQSGSIDVTTGEPATVYFNERLIDSGTHVTRDVPAGDYRVVLKLGDGRLTRVRTVTVRKGETAHVAFHAGVEGALRVEKTWTGLLFANQAERVANEGAFARIVANDVNASGVVIIGIETINGRPKVTGALIQLIDGTDLRRGYVALDASEHVLRGLVDFLIDKKEVDGVVPIKSKYDKPPWGGWKFLSGAVALGAIGAGAYYVHLDGTCKVKGDGPCPDLYSTAGQGYAALAGGAVFVGVTAYLIVRELRAKGPVKRSEAYVVPTHGGAFAGYALRF